MIIKTFNELFGNIQWKDEDKIRKVIAEEIPARVAQDKAYQNAQANSDKQNAKLEHDKALNRVVQELLSDHTELFKQFSDNPSFKRWLTDTVFDATYQTGRGRRRHRHRWGRRHEQALVWEDAMSRMSPEDQVNISALCRAAG